MNLLSGSPINCISTPRVAGRYRVARLRILDRAAAHYVESVTRKDTLQVCLPLDVEFQNINSLGRSKDYSRLAVPNGGYTFPAFDLNHSYENCDSTLRLAEDVGIGTRDLNRIEVIGTPIKEAVVDFAAIRRKRRAANSSPVGAASTIRRGFAK